MGPQSVDKFFNKLLFIYDVRGDFVYIGMIF